MMIGCAQVDKCFAQGGTTSVRFWPGNGPTPQLEIANLATEHPNHFEFPEW